MTSGISHAQRALMGLPTPTSGVPVDVVVWVKDLGLAERVRAILAVWGVTMTDILGRRRLNAIARARHHVWALLYFSGQSYSAIARVFRFDHTTVMAGVDGHVERYGVPK